MIIVYLPIKKKRAQHATQLDLLELVALILEELQDIQRLQGHQAGAADLLQLVVTLVPGLQFQVNDRPVNSMADAHGITALDFCGIIPKMPS